MIGKMTEMEKVEDHQTFMLLPEAEYVFEIAEKTDGVTKRDDPMVSLVLVVDSGEFKGVKIWDNIILADNKDNPAWKMRWRAKMFLKAIGEPHHGDSFVWDSDRWVWRKVIGVIEHQTQKEGKYAGQLQAKIVKYLPIDESVVAGADEVLPEPAPEDLALRKPKVTAPPIPAPDVADDDIPF